MFGLTSSGNKIALDKSKNLTIRVSNPAFDKDFVGREFSLPFTIPEGGNHNITNNENHINNIGNIIEDITVSLAGVPYKNVFFTVLNRTSSQTDGYLNAAINDAITKLEKIYINQILEKIDVGASTFTGIDLRPQTSFPGPLSYSLTIKEQTFSHTENSSINQSTLAATALFNQINTAFPNLCRLVGDHIIFDDYITNPIFDVDNSSISNTITIFTWQTAPVYFEQTYRTFANNAVQLGDDRVCFPSVYNPGFYDGKNINFRNFINEYVNEFAQNTINTTIYNGDRNTIIPFVKEKYIMQRIADVLGFDEIKVELPDFDQFCLYNVFSNDFGTIDFHDSPFGSPSSLGVKRHMHGYKGEIDLNAHVPELTAKDYILGICMDFDLCAILEGQTLSLVSRKPFYSKKPINYTKYANREYLINIAESKGFTIEYTKDDADKFPIITSHGLGGVVDGAGEYNASLHFSTLPVEFKEQLGNSATEMPCSNQVGTSSIFSTNGKVTGLRRLLYKGNSPFNNSNGVPHYPFATNTNKDSLGNPSGTLSLLIQGNNGIYEVSQKEILKLLVKSQKLKKQLQLPVGQFLNIIFQQEYNAMFYHPKGTAIGVISELNATFSNKRYGFIDVEVEVLLV